MKDESNIDYDVISKKLVWYEHVQKMIVERLSEQVLDWIAPERRR